MSFGLATLRDWLARAGGESTAIHAQRPARWVVVDTETSGLDPVRDRLLAIGGVAVDDDGIRIDDSFEIVVRTEAPNDSANIAVHGIGREAQAAGVPAHDALAAYADWVAGAPLVGFHTDFDRAVLRKACAGAGIPAKDAPWLDLALLAGALLPGQDGRGDRGLDHWLASFGIECLQRHNAAADALATAELLLRLRSLAARQGARGFTALAKTAREQKWLGGTR